AHSQALHCCSRLRRTTEIFSEAPADRGPECRSLPARRITRAMKILEANTHKEFALDQISYTADINVGYDAKSIFEPPALAA
ncbi:MAG: hypothetical protein WAV38_26320, partial [Xanthobacteraceae bacterium]